MMYDTIRDERVRVLQSERVTFRWMFVLAILIHILILYIYFPQASAGSRKGHGLPVQSPPMDIVRLPPEKAPPSETVAPRRTVQTVKVIPSDSPEDTLVVLPPTIEYQIEGLEDIEIEPPPPSTGPLIAGGDVIAPKLIRSVKPVYPALAIKMGLEGMVIIEAIVSRTGVVTSARVMRPVSGILDEAALEAVKAYEYSPGTLNGVPMDVIMTVTVQFIIDR